MNDFKFFNKPYQKMPSKLFMISVIIFTGFSVAIILCLSFIRPKVPFIYTAKLFSSPKQKSSMHKFATLILESDSAVLDVHSDILFTTKSNGKQIKVPINMKGFQRISPEGKRIKYIVILKKSDIDFFSEDSVLNGELVILKSSTKNLFNNLLSK